jgi:hypothetical protein
MDELEASTGILRAYMTLIRLMSHRMSCDRTTLACEYNLFDLFLTPQICLCTLDPTLTPAVAS